jgi:hypothetical protein
MHMHIKGLRKVVSFFLTFGPDVCLTFSASTRTMVSSRPALYFLMTAHVEASIQSTTVDLRNTNLDYPDLRVSYYIAPKVHVTPLT